MRTLLINTGTARNLGDRAMLLNVARMARAQRSDATLRVSADVPGWLLEEFNLHPTPTLLHLWGRWATIASRLRLSGKASNLLSPLYHVFCTVSCALLAFMPSPIRRRIPGMEGRFINAMATTDLIYFTGGGYLTDEGKLEARAVLLTGLLGRLRGARLAMTGQGIGPFSSRVTKWLMRETLLHSDIIRVREQQSARYWFDVLKISRDAWESGVDDAGSLPCTVRSREVTCSPGTLAVHFRVSPFHTGTHELSPIFLEIIQSHLSAGYQVKLFVFQEQLQTELEPYKQWMAALNTNAVRIVRTPDPRIIRSELAACNRAIGMAYHFLLFALLSNLPAVAIYTNKYYRAKFQGLATYFDKPECLLGAMEFDADEVSLRLATMERAPASISNTSASANYAEACNHQILSAFRSNIGSASDI